MFEMLGKKWKILEVEVTLVYYVGIDVADHPTDAVGSLAAVVVMIGPGFLDREVGSFHLPKYHDRMLRHLHTDRPPLVA